MTSKKKEQKVEEPKRLGQCKTLTELKTFLEASDKATAKFDLILVKGGKVSELMKSFDKVRGESKDFKTASKVRAHVKHREKAEWVFEKKTLRVKIHILSCRRLPRLRLSFSILPALQRQ
jgi:hypothetical protein